MSFSKPISYAEVMMDYAEEDIPDDITNTLRDIVRLSSEPEDEKPC